MTSELSIFAARLREQIGIWTEAFAPDAITVDPNLSRHADIEFNGLALMLFTLQFAHNEPYRKLCIARGVTLGDVSHWSQIPTVPTAAFKEFEMTCLLPEERTRVFHSSGTTEQRPSHGPLLPNSSVAVKTSVYRFRIGRSESRWRPGRTLERG